MFLEGSCPSCSAPIHPRHLLKVEKTRNIPPFLPTNRALLSGPRVGWLHPYSQDKGWEHRKSLCPSLPSPSSDMGP